MAETGRPEATIHHGHVEASSRMSETFAVVLAIFGLIGIGYLVARLGWLAAAVGEALTEFVFKVAIPCLLFETIATADLGGLSPWRIWGAYFGPFICIWAISHIMVRQLFGRDARAAVVGGGSAAYANSVLIGVPLISAAFGEAGIVFLVVIVAIHLPIMMLASVVLNEWAMRADGVGEVGETRSAALRRVARAMATHPILLAIAAGLIWRNLGLTFPSALAAVIEPLARAAGPIALFASGMSLVTFGVARQVRPAVAIAALKLLAMPALVYAAAVGLALPPLGVAVVTLIAACPTGVNAFIIASRLGTGTALAAKALLISTAAGVVTVTLWLAVLRGGLG